MINSSKTLYVNSDFVEPTLKIASYNDKQKDQFIARIHNEIIKLNIIGTEYIQVDKIKHTYKGIVDSTYSSNNIKGETMCTDNKGSQEIKKYLSSIDVNSQTIKDNIYKIITMNNANQIWFIMNEIQNSDFKSLHKYLYKKKRELAIETDFILFYQDEIDLSKLNEYNDIIEVK